MFYSNDVGFTENRVHKSQVEISESSWNELISGQSNGMIIKAGSDGYPFLDAPPEPTKEQKIAAEKTEKDSRKSKVFKAISVYQMKLQLGRELTAAETESLNAWLNYSDALDAIDISNTSLDTTIVWPVEPEL